jgi:hypothetical protein
MIMTQRQALHTRKDLALQLLSMPANASTTPVLRLALRARTMEGRHDDGEGSKAISVGSNDGNYCS